MKRSLSNSLNPFFSPLCVVIFFLDTVQVAVNRRFRNAQYLGQGIDAAFEDEESVLVEVFDDGQAFCLG